MTRSFFTGKHSALSGYKARLTGVSLTALAFLGVARQASAQEAALETVPDGYKLASDLKDYDSATTLADGSVEIVLETGETVTVAASDISIVGGEIYIAESAVQLAGMSFGAGAIGTTALVAGAAILAAGGVALASSGGGSDDDSAPSPSPLPDAGNSAPVLSVPASVTSSENQTSAFTASASDADGDVLTYSLAGGDSEQFSINAATGVVTFNDVPDFEAPTDGNADNVYSVTVSATDGTDSVSQTVNITVTNENEAPEIAAIDPVLVEENQTSVTTIAASDEDGDALSFTLSGADAGLFAVDVATGLVTFIDAPDFETPGDADGNNVYEVTVTASDGTLSDSQDIIVTLMDVNEAPMVTSGLSFTSAENQTAAFTATATDVDGDTLTYTLSGDDAALFAIDGSTGVVTFLEAPDFETPGDLGGDNVYDVAITANDGVLTSTQNVAITVSDVNEAPIVTSGPAFTVAENQIAAFTATATDPDNDALTYTLSGGDAALFAIDASTGVVTFLEAPDFETPGDLGGDNVYDIAVTASDGGLTSTQNVAITVSDVNEAPVVTSGPAFTVAENQIAAFTATATDPDNDVLTYTLSGGDAALFAIDASSGVVTFLETPDFETPGDLGGDNVYDIAVTASDGGLTSTQNVAITVSDVNEAPIVTFGPAFTVAENQTAAFTATATDVDGDTVTFALSGDDAALFAIDASTGVVTFLEAPDFETPGDADGDNVFDVTVTASDGELSSAQAVAITVSDVNEAPVVTSGPSFNAAENQASAFTATATDADNDALTYTLSGDDAALFAIDASTGVVTFLEAPDFETPGDLGDDNVFDVTITANDGVLTSTQNVAITVSDVNEAPVVTSGPAFTVAENQIAAFTATATDADNDALTYTLSGGDAALFAIDASTGVVTFLEAPDFETPGDADGDNVFDVTVTASDGELSSAQAVAITVSDVNEAPVVTSGPSFNAAENQASAFTATATDADNDALTYTLSGDDAALFAIDASTGVVTFLEAPDFEAPGDLGGDNVYNVAVTASDGGLTSTQNVAITVSDVNEAPVVTSGPAFTVAENQIAAFTATATDADNDALTYTLSGGDAALFAIDASSGVVTFLEAPDFETPGDLGGDNVYNVAVTASDGGLTSTQNVAITVSDVDETPPDAPLILSVGLINEVVMTDDGEWVFQFLPAITGVAEAGSTVEIFDGLISLGTTTAQEDGSFILTAPFRSLSDELLAVTATDAAGNVSDMGSFDAVFGINPTEFFEEADAASIIAADITSGSGFVVFDSEGTLLLPRVSDAGDINNDGIDDIVVSSSSGNINGEQSGVAAVIFGREAGFGEIIEGQAVIDFANLQAEDGFIVAGEVDFDFLQVTDAIGDFNGDGIDDIVLGSNGANEAYILFGGALDFGEIDGAGRQVLNVSELTPEAGIVLSNGVPSGGGFGFPIATPGDINGDGLGDIVLGDTDFNGAFVVYGTSDVLGESDDNGRTVLDLSSLTPDEGFQILGDINTSIFVGFEVSAAGDINGDGLADFNVSAPLFDNDFGENFQGAGFIVFGSETAPGDVNGVGVSVLDLSTFDASDGLRIIGTDLSINADGGFVAPIGDFNGDGFDDLLIQSSNFFNPEGDVLYIAFGSANGFGTDEGILDLSALTADTGITIIDPLQGRNRFDLDGIGDFNNDGFDDVLIGSGSGSDFDGNPGFAFVVFGGSDVGDLTDANERLIDLSDLSALDGFEIAGQIDTDSVGRVISSAGDVNNDGTPDILVSVQALLDGPVSAIVIFGGQTFAGDSASVAIVEENTTAAFVATSLGEGTSYQLLGDDAALFTINQTTGLVSFIDAPDFETLFTDEVLNEVLGDLDDLESLEDLDTENFVFDLEIEATDGVHTTTQDVAILVTDVNEFAPEFVTSDTLVSSNGTYFVFASDDDGTPIVPAFENGGDITFSDGLTYEIVGGADASLFTIETGPALLLFAGELSFIERPDTANPVDADGDGIYEVIVSASDGELTTTQTLSLNLVDGGALPVFSGNTNFSIDEFAEDVSFQLTAVDPDGVQVGYVLAQGLNDDSDLFNINFVTGELSFNTPPSFEFPQDQNGDNIYNLTVLALDGSDVGAQAVTVTVNDLEFAPTLFGDTEFSIQENNGTGEQSSVAFFIASDLDQDFVSAMVTGGADAAFFDTFNEFFFFEDSGYRLFSDTSFDFEMPLDADGDNVYEVEVTLSDGTNETVELFQISILDFFESPNAPIFTTPDTFNVNEGETFVVDANADDADGEQPTYSLQGDEFFNFFINRTTGELNFNGPVQFDESGVQDNSFTVDIVADDGSSNQTIQTITVNIQDIDVAPMLFIPGNASVNENQSTSFFISASEAFDEQEITLSIQGDDVDAFDLQVFFEGVGSAQGNITLLAQDFETPADADGDGVYTVDVVTSDGVNTVVETFNVSVADVFESANAPVFVSPSTIMADEGPFGIIASTVAATDADGEVPTFSITGGQDRFNFSIDSETGEISFASSIAFNPNPSSSFDDNFFEIEVTADDGSTNTTTQMITIEIQDADVAPVLSSLPQSMILIDENTGFSDFIIGRDSFDGQFVTLSISGPDVAFFQLTGSFSVTGFASASLELISPLDFETPLDADGDNIYDLEITVSDGVNFVTEMISFTVLDTIESANAPVFTSANLVSVDEGQAVILIPVATDADNEIPDIFLSGGDDRSSFRIDNETGELQFFDPPQFNFNPTGSFDDNSFEVELTADDGTGNQTTQLITVEIIDVDVAPEISLFGTSNETTFENDLFSLQFFATDSFENQFLTVSLGGIDAGAFDLQENFALAGFSNINLNLTEVPDFENPTDADQDNVYVVDLIVSDGVNETIETITLTVEDVFESPNAPVFTSATTTTVDEGQPLDFQVAATDADGETVEFSITGGDDASFFDISPTGAVEFTTFDSNAPNFVADNGFDSDGDNIYEIEITATDSSNNVVQQLAIEVNDVNIAPVISVPPQNGFIFENDDNIRFTASASDADGDDVTLSVGGPDGALFQFDFLDDGAGDAFGILQIIGPLDFENPTDANGDNIYEFDVIASDGVNETIESVTLTISDVLEDESGTAKTSAEADSTFSDFGGELSEGTAALASFNVDTDDSIDLNDMASGAVSLSDIQNTDFMPETAVFAEDNVDQVSVQLDAVALEMQFAADLLMLQESAADVEG